MKNDLGEDTKAATRAFLATSHGSAFMNWLAKSCPPLADFDKFKSDRQFDISVGEVKGHQGCIKMIESVFDQNIAIDPTAIESMSFKTVNKEE